MAEQNYTKIAVRGALVVLLISGISAVLGYGVRLLFARELSVEDFGLFYAVFSFLAFISLFKTMGFEKALVKFIPDLLYEKKKDELKGALIFVFLLQLGLNLIALFAITLFSGFLSEHFFHTPKAGPILNLMAVAFLIDSCLLVLKMTFQGFRKMVLFGLIDFFRMGSVILISLYFFSEGKGIDSAVLAYLITPLLLLLLFGSLFIWKVFPEFFTVKTKIGLDSIKKMSHYSFFVMATGSAAMVLHYTDSMMLTYFSGLEQVALYNVAFPIAKLLTYVPTAIGSILLPLSAELWAKGKKAEVRDGLEKLYKYSFLAILPLCLLLGLFSREAILILFGENYTDASMAMRVITLGIVFLTLHLINVYFMSGIGHPSIHAKIVYIAAFFNFAANLLLIPSFGILGAAISTSFCNFLMMAIGFFHVRKFIALRFPFLDWGKICLAGILMCALVLFLKGHLLLDVILESVLLCAIGGIAYIGLLYLLGALTMKETMDIHKRIFS